MSKIQNEISLLKPPFIHAAKWMLNIIEQENLPLKVFETLRSEERQNLLKAKKVSKASYGDSPHNFGLAFDLVLDTRLIKVREREWKGRLYPDAWDDSTPAAVDAWQRLGQVCDGMGLEWGGSWTKSISKIRKNSKGEEVLLGWDIPHIELKSWRKYRNG